MTLEISLLSQIGEIISEFLTLLRRF